MPRLHEPVAASLEELYDGLPDVYAEQAETCAARLRTSTPKDFEFTQHVRVQSHGHLWTVLVTTTGMRADAEKALVYAQDE
jgi:hypothetical protein